MVRVLVSAVSVCLYSLSTMENGDGECGVGVYEATTSMLFDGQKQETLLGEVKGIPEIPYRLVVFPFLNGY